MSKAGVRMNGMLEIEPLGSPGMPGGQLPLAKAERGS